MSGCSRPSKDSGSDAPASGSKAECPCPATVKFKEDGISEEGLLRRPGPDAERRGEGRVGDQSDV